MGQLLPGGVELSNFASLATAESGHKPNRLTTPGGQAHHQGEIKTIHRKLLPILLSLLASPALAIEAEGAVAVARAHDSTLWGVDSNFIQVEGFSEAGSCPVYAGLVVLRLRGDKLGDRQTAIALAVQLAGKKVRVSVDPAFAGPDGCWLRWINLLP